MWFAVVLGLLVGGIAWLSGPHGKVLAESKQAGGHQYTVIVTQYGGRYNIQLVEERRPIRDLLWSSYEFYEGSLPVTTTITWLTPQAFVVSFDNGISGRGSWDEHDDHDEIVWTREFKPPD
jgi:hypothetical protein